MSPSSAQIGRKTTRPVFILSTTETVRCTDMLACSGVVAPRTRASTDGHGTNAKCIAPYTAQTAWQDMTACGLQSGDSYARAANMLPPALLRTNFSHLFKNGTAVRSRLIGVMMLVI